MTLFEFKVELSKTNALLEKILEVLERVLPPAKRRPPASPEKITVSETSDTMTLAEYAQHLREHPEELDYGAGVDLDNAG